MFDCTLFSFMSACASVCISMHYIFSYNITQYICVCTLHMSLCLYTVRMCVLACVCAELYEYACVEIGTKQRRLSWSRHCADPHGLNCVIAIVAYLGFTCRSDAWLVFACKTMVFVLKSGSKRDMNKIKNEKKRDTRMKYETCVWDMKYAYV